MNKIIDTFQKAAYNCRINSTTTNSSLYELSNGPVVVTKTEEFYAETQWNRAKEAICTFILTSKTKNKAEYLFKIENETLKGMENYLSIITNDTKTLEEILTDLEKEGDLIYKTL